MTTTREETRAPAPPITTETTRRGGLALYLAQVGALVWKDLLAERRTKEILSATLVFGLLVVLIFNFAFDLRRAEMDLIGPGILWVAFIFAGILGLNRSFALVYSTASARVSPISPCLAAQ